MIKEIDRDKLEKCEKSLENFQLIFTAFLSPQCFLIKTQNQNHFQSFFFFASDSFLINSLDRTKDAKI